MQWNLGGCFIRDVDGCGRCSHDEVVIAKELFSRGLLLVPVATSGFDYDEFASKFDAPIGPDVRSN